ncbi:LacI family DNA-binding transcriptional regulator [Rubrobacter indicoceani]|uniref:LacI family DNA-binding transcriptional regulator n=1 Tax=Rubrobacter indicoceani TaxID=2051957 RepID=UPI000E5C2F4D|nr:LacI family DNA-binding transcriptional regulator [Rubrobacter indicoceani]
MTSIKDVAREAGVSVATVSRTFSGAQPVSEKVKERVRDSARKIGYRPNALARSLRVEETMTLGLVVPSIINPFFTNLARAIEDAAWEDGYSIMLGNTDESVEKEARYLELLLEKRVDGIIVSPARAESPALQRVVGEVPVVFIDRLADGVEAPVVRASGDRAVRELAGYLIGLGHERLGVISGPADTVSGRERLDAFLTETLSLGVPVPGGRVRIGDFRRESGAQAMRELLALGHPPTAVFVANNSMALGALLELRGRGLRVPEDVSVASFDDVGWFDLLSPPLTAIAQPVREMGVVAAKTLARMLAGEGAGEIAPFEAELIVRGSCAPPNGRVASNGHHEGF